MKILTIIITLLSINIAQAQVEECVNRIRTHVVEDLVEENIVIGSTSVKAYIWNNYTTFLRNFCSVKAIPSNDIVLNKILKCYDEYASQNLHYDATKGYSNGVTITYSQVLLKYCDETMTASYAYELQQKQQYEDYIKSIRF